MVRDAAEVIVLFAYTIGLGPDDSEAEAEAAYESDAAAEPDAA